MGNQKQKWTQDEEDALIAGVEKHGPGKWKNILKDPQFAPFLTSRSNIDLKDKWRNLSVSNGSQGSKDKPRVPKLKALPPPPSSTTSTTTTATPQNAASAPQNVPSDVTVPDSSLNDQDVKNPPRYNAMVFEALSALKDNNGSDLSAIVSFIEQKHQVPQNFRRALSTRLRRLVSQGKLEKVQNCYKIKKDVPSGTKSPSPKPKDVRPAPSQPAPQPQWQSSVSVFTASNETIKDAADTAAYRIADAESKSYLAAEAVKEAEKISLLVEHSDSMLELAKDIYEQCSRGEIILLA
ncbi:telomere repeat-binding factor 4-like isoform X1 [Vigna umbellata]|uniref:telomere repeat-binding factor 4-like isoform X1 n=1 Tax=Vigna umbellata TaxID=87088 RepID=UPI001F5E53DA|nr:telomere repeat-binding factor 4-like isoform X1 [Vigna umbellata]